MSLLVSEEIIHQVENNSSKFIHPIQQMFYVLKTLFVINLLQLLTHNTAPSGQSLTVPEFSSPD